jgi:hypothetical protein
MKIHFSSLGVFLGHYLLSENYHVDAKFIRDLNFKLKLINKLIILLSLTLVRK